MDLLRKPDWIPLRIQRVKSSSIWLVHGTTKGLPDYQFGWFWRGIIELADSNTPGFVDEGSVELWKFFGAKSEMYFRKWGGNEFAGRYFPKTEDGTKRYNAQLLEILRNQGRRVKKPDKEELENKSSLSLSILEFDLLDKQIEELFKFYISLFERNKNYSLTEQRRKKCAARLVEHMKASVCQLDAAVSDAKLAMTNLRTSEFHWKNGHFDWIDQIFKSREMFEKRLGMRNDRQVSKTEERQQRTRTAILNGFGIVPSTGSGSGHQQNGIDGNRSPVLEGKLLPLPGGDD